MEDIKTISRLFERYLNDECSRDEIRSLLQYFDAGENEAILKDLIHKHFEALANVDDPSSFNQKNQSLLDASLINIKKAIAKGETNDQAPVFHISRRTWSFVAAAIFLLLISTTTVLLIHQKRGSALAQNENNNRAAKDIAPGHDNAILTLADGTAVVLDSAVNGTLTKQGNSKVIKINGQLAYYKLKDKDVDGTPVYNAVTTARGNQYQLVLTDGTRVWLNASSSIRFPVYFTGNERKVEVTGEAYFEVAKDAKKPFKVVVVPASGETNATEIDVLGTHFNVNAYQEEPDIKTTLLEGAVKIKRANTMQMLSPGQQARVTPSGITLEKNINLSQVMAWKEGLFSFDNTDIRLLMRQVERWYDVDVDFEGKITEEGFSGRISRNVPLSEFLKALELNDVHIKRMGRKITVMP